MKVLEKGTTDGQAFRYRCSGSGSGNGDGGCGATLLVEPGDVFVTLSHARNESTNYRTIRCTDCGVWSDLTRDFKIAFKPRPKNPELDGHRSGEGLPPPRVPVEYDARQAYITDHASSMLHLFRMGQKKAFLEGLKELETGVAFAILATALDATNRITRYLRDTA